MTSWIAKSPVSRSFTKPYWIRSVLWWKVRSKFPKVMYIESGRKGWNWCSARELLDWIAALEKSNSSYQVEPTKGEKIYEATRYEYLGYSFTWRFFDRWEDAERLGILCRTQWQTIVQDGRPLKSRNILCNNESQATDCEFLIDGKAAGWGNSLHFLKRRDWTLSFDLELKIILCTDIEV